MTSDLEPSVVYDTYAPSYYTLYILILLIGQLQLINYPSGAIVVQSAGQCEVIRPAWQRDFPHFQKIQPSSGAHQPPIQWV
jgi:hypothetical protein